MQVLDILIPLTAVVLGVLYFMRRKARLKTDD